MPLHLKPVHHARAEELVRMARELTASVDFHEVGKFAERGLGWLTDDKRYEEVAKRATAHGMPMRSEKQSCIALGPSEIALIRRPETCRIVPQPRQAIRAWTRMLTRDEEAKNRRRILCEPFLNDIVTREDLQYCRSGGPDRVRGLVKRWRYMIQFDMQSWYDQLPLSTRVQLWHGLRAADGQTYCLHAASMGGRPSCEAAQGATWALSTFNVPPSDAGRGLRLGDDFDLASIIDNVAYFADDMDELSRIAMTFLHRCEQAGAQVNDIDFTVALLPQIVSRITTTQTFGGEEYNLVAKTRMVSAKTKAKLDAAAELLQTSLVNGTELSFRQWAALLGLIFYTSELMQHHLDSDPKRRAFKSYCRLMKMCSGFDRKRWDYAVPPGSMPDASAVLALIVTLRAAGPVPVETEPKACGYTIITDASAEGWAGCMVNHRTKTISFAQGRWPTQRTNGGGHFGSSVWAEPEAIVQVSARLLPAGCTDGVVFITDHAGMVWAAEARAAWRSVCADAYDSALRRLTALFPGASFRGRFISGATNPLDAASRWLTTEAPTAKAIDVAVASATLPRAGGSGCRQWQQWMR